VFFEQGDDQGPGHLQTPGDLCWFDLFAGPESGLADLPVAEQGGAAAFLGQPGRSVLAVVRADPGDLDRGQPEQVGDVLAGDLRLGQCDDRQVAQTQVVLRVGGDQVAAAADLHQVAAVDQVQVQFPQRSGVAQVEFGLGVGGLHGLQPTRQHHDYQVS
jgi:hypothetical protein